MKEAAIVPRGFSSASIKFMRLLCEGWMSDIPIRYLTINELPDESKLLLCERVNKPFVQLTVQGYSQPIGIATYRALKNIPQPYKALAPVIDGVRKVMVEYKGGRRVKV